MPRRRPGSFFPLELSILKVCRDEGDAGVHGFAMAQAIADAEESRRLTATGTLYRALQRLDDRGLLESWWEDPVDAAEAGRPRRRLYRITAAGATALIRTESDPDELPAHQLEPGYLS